MTTIPRTRKNAGTSAVDNLLERNERHGKLLTRGKIKMPTYKQIQNYVKEKYGFIPKTCWIADLKSQYGLTTKVAYNRKGKKRVHPCPESKKKFIISAFRHFSMVE